ncbi:MAG: hypothetical protein AAF672_12440, partial [Pseudomonadota bacterium]
MQQTQDLTNPSSETCQLMNTAARAAERVADMAKLLETLADTLPKCSPPMWRVAQIRCGTTLKPHFMTLTRHVIPTLSGYKNNSIDQHALLMRFDLDCIEQLHSLTDLDDLLSDVLEDRGPAKDAEALGYALRGHFDEIRRTLAWETEVIWPLAARVLRGRDIDRI